MVEGGILLISATQLLTVYQNGDSNFHSENAKRLIMNSGGDFASRHELVLAVLGCAVLTYLGGTNSTHISDCNRFGSSLLSTDPDLQKILAEFCAIISTTPE